MSELNGCPLASKRVTRVVRRVRALQAPLTLGSFIGKHAISVAHSGGRSITRFNGRIDLCVCSHGRVTKNGDACRVIRRPICPTGGAVLGSQHNSLILLVGNVPLVRVRLGEDNVPIDRTAGRVRGCTRRNIFANLFHLIRVFITVAPSSTICFTGPNTSGFGPDCCFR